MINLTSKKDCVRGNIWNYHMKISVLNSMNDLLWACVKGSLRYSLIYHVEDFVELTKIKIKHSARSRLND